MKAFSGFQDSETYSRMPDSLFRELLAVITEVAELKVVLHALWLADHIEGPVQALAVEDFDGAALGLEADAIQQGLDLAVRHQILLQAGRGPRLRYFPNTPVGRASLSALQAGTSTDVSSAPLERPNIFQLYEENIGPLTPLIADALKDAEQTYPPTWIVDAIDLAVRNNKRSWSYCQAILKRWKEEGRGKKQNRRDDQAARQRDVEEKVRKFING